MIKNYAIANTELLGRNKIVKAIKLLIICLFLARNLLMKFTLFLLSYAITKNAKLLFFSSTGNYNFPLWRNEADFQFKESPKYLAIYSTKKLKDFITVFHVPNSRLFDKIKSLGIIPTKGLHALWYMLRAKYLFVDNNNFFSPNASYLVGRFQIIQCWHGTPLKSMGEDRKCSSKPLERIKNIEKSKFKCVLSTCEHTTKIFKKLFYTEKVLEIGFPRNDIFFNPQFFSCEKMDEELNLSQYKKVLLYAPTFRKIEQTVNPFGPQFFSKLNELLRQKNYLFLIKQHPYVKMVKGLGKFSNIKDVSDLDDDIQELLVHSDVLISDYSSMIFDFALSEKLQLFYPFDKEQYVKDRGEFYFEYNEENLPGVIIKNENNLIERIEQLDALTKNELIKTRIKEFKRKFNRYTDGKSCERLFDYLNLTTSIENR